LLELGNHPLMAWAVRASVTRIARLFLVEDNRSALVRALRDVSAAGAQATIDAVGEAVLTEAEAESYVRRYREVLAAMHAAGLAPHASIKLSALTPRFDPIDSAGSRARVFERIAPLMHEGVSLRAGLTIDMERYELKPLILDTFRALVEAYPDAG
jgi:RHH-type proline utilization regulon transcriptional repressor/proline dehydrogenase/delta 1-pyrroline-5-carboxylate dehydrogenase